MKIGSFLKRRGSGFASDARGVAAVEFALAAPVVIMIMVALVDLGSVLFIRFQLDSAVAAGANYALVNGSSVSSTNGAALASTLAGVVASSQGTNSAASTITVNNGPAASSSGGTVTPSGTASSADSCYCPTGSGSGIAWGSAQTCGTTCTGGGYAGKFVVLSASRSYSPLLTGYGFANSGTVSTTSVVQVQ
jgi:Flp pilus assembly protein TadG